MNLAGLIVAALGAILVVIALRGTQGQVLPGLFPTPNQGNPGNQTCPSGWDQHSSGSTTYCTPSTGNSATSCPKCFTPFNIGNQLACLPDIIGQIEGKC